MKLKNIKITNDILKKYSRNKKDTGSSEVQIAFLTYRINNLNIHLKKFKKDIHSKRGLLKMINKKRKLLIYLKKNNIYYYNLLINKLKQK